MPQCTAVIHQPDFLPYLGFFERLLHAEVFVILDHVQFARRGWTHRDKIKTRDGADWITMSLRHAPRDAAIRDILLSWNSEWKDAHLNKLRENYRLTPYFEEIFEPIECIYSMPFETMIEMNAVLIDQILRWLDISVKRVRSSEFAPVGGKSEMLAGLVDAVGCNRYLSGIGARKYHDQRPFDERGILVSWQEFEHPTYPQQYAGFLPYLSVLDALFNCGPQGTRAMLDHAQRQKLNDGLAD